MANIDEPDHVFLFRKVFAGDRGIRQALIATFIKKYVEALRVEGLAEQWDETQYDKAATVLARLNFDDKVEIEVKTVALKVKAPTSVKPKRSLVSREAQ